MNMGPVEINHVLNSHFEENEKLLDEIIRVKSKSRDKSSTYNPSHQDNLGQTSAKSK